MHLSLQYTMHLTMDSFSLKLCSATIDLKHQAVLSLRHFLWPATQQGCDLSPYRGAHCRSCRLKMFCRACGGQFTLVWSYRLSTEYIGMVQSISVMYIYGSSIIVSTYYQFYYQQTYFFNTLKKWNKHLKQTLITITELQIL